LTDKRLTIGSGSRSSGVAPNRENRPKNVGQRSPAAPNCPLSSPYEPGGRRFESCWAHTISLCEMVVPSRPLGSAASRSRSTRAVPSPAGPTNVN